MELVHQLYNNPDIKKIKNKRPNEINDKDMFCIIKYRYKYCLSRIDIMGMFNVTMRKIIYWESKMDEDFKNRLTELNVYKENLKKNSSYLKCK